MANIGTTSMVKFTTTRFGLVEVDEQNIVEFVDEIPGFPGAERFVVIPHAENSPFSWLQSIELPDVAFVVADPWLFFEDYKPVLSEADLERLELYGDIEESLAVLSIFTIPSDPKKMTANLKAPVVINSKNNKAKQIILANEEYSTKHLILPES